MKNNKFVCTVIDNLSQELFDELKDLLIPKFISFSVIKNENITKEILKEWLINYFSYIELSFVDHKIKDHFNAILGVFISELDSVIKDKIAETPKKKKKDTSLPKTPRARKYYEKFASIKESTEISFDAVVDYTRIMLCLYSSIIKNEYNKIDDFDYSFSVVNVQEIITAYCSDFKSHLPITSKPYVNQFKLNNYSSIILMLLYYYIKANEVVGEY